VLLLKIPTDRNMTLVRGGANTMLRVIHGHDGPIFVLFLSIFLTVLFLGAFWLAMFTSLCVGYLNHPARLGQDHQDRDEARFNLHFCSPLKRTCCAVLSRIELAFIQFCSLHRI
jgi:hypothetical protein